MSTSSASSSSSTSSVRVAVRVRPLTAQEIQQNCHDRITFTPNQPQITVGGERSFTFDYAYPPSADQEQVYSTCVVPLLQKYLDGYNSTILAYGQTGSGKTYSMGIGLESATQQQDGIVPRFVHSLFEQLTAKSNAMPSYSYQVLVTFLELYNEDLVDLLRQPRVDGLNLSIREDSQGNICWIGVREESVNNAYELLELLNRGSIARTTASTDMNRVSSRSHAIFSVILKQNIPDDQDNNIEKRLVSKFHFVDLAGSERLKRTNAVGDRAREGISINTGLLALGNVISALGDESRKVSHIPYRDSKLTRLLQDSLGGNSQTLMLACVSPADSNYTETLNTLKYANRARNIRNRVTVNHEVSGNDSDKLKAHVLKLKEELKANEEFLRAVNHEMDSLKSEVQVLTATVTKMTQELALTKCERDMLKSQQEQGIPFDGLVAEYAQTIERLRTEIKLQAGRQQAPPPLPPSPPASSHTPKTSSAPAAAPTQQQQAAGDQKSPRKKRHSYRFGSKRGRRRVSINFNSSPKPKPNKPSSAKTPNSDVYHTIQKAKSELLDEMAFLKAAQGWSSFHHHQQHGGPWHRASTPPTPDDSDIMEFANSFPDQSLTLTNSSHEQQLPPSTYNLVLKFKQCIESKSELIQQLERGEMQRSEMQEQHANAISELTSKKNAALVQHRRDVNELRAQYESRLKKQTSELNALRRKHAQALRSAETTRSKSNAIILGLKQKLDKANGEKKKMAKKLKQESDRAREKCSHLDKELHKLKRQESQAVQARKRMERDMVQHKATAKRATEEMIELSSQMKHVALMLKKVMANDKVVDRTVLAKAMACASVRGYIIRQSLQRSRKKKLSKSNDSASNKLKPLYRKKRLLQRAIAMHVRATRCRTDVSDLTQKRDRLQREQQELLAERQRVLLDEAQQLGNNASVDASVPQYMDDRIDTITVQLDFYNDQLARLEKDNNSQEQQWTDVCEEEAGGEEELDQVIKDDPQVAYQVALALIRSLEPEEARLIAEALMDEIIELRQQQASPTLMQGMDATIQKLQQTIVQMRRQATATAGWISEESTVFDRLFARAMMQPVQFLNGLALPAKKILQNSVSTPTNRSTQQHYVRTRKRSMLPHRSPPPRAESSPAIVRM